MVLTMTKLVYAHDGISVYDELFLNSLKRKYDVYVLTFHSSPTHIPSGVEVIKIMDMIPETKLHPFEGLRKHLLTPIRIHAFKKHLSKIKPQVLIGCWASTYGFYSVCSKFHPFVLFVWGSDVLVFPKKYFPLKPLVTFALRKADMVVVDSDVQKEAAIKLGCPPNRILKFPWVDLNEFESDRNKRVEIRKQFGWSEDDIVVISLRDHKKIYGVEYLINAIPYISKKNKKIKFLVLGEGPQTELFKVKVKKFMEGNQVKLIGKIPHKQVASYLNAADIYVSTSFSDGTSASLLEAMSCSLVPVVTRIAGNEEWVKNGLNGYLVPTADSIQLAEKIILLAKSDELRLKLGLKAKETIQTAVNWERSMQKLTKIIDDMTFKHLNIKTL